MGFFSREVRPSADAEFTAEELAAREEQQIALYQRQIEDGVRDGNPSRKFWRLHKSAKKSTDVEYLELVRAAAENIHDPWGRRTTDDMERPEFWIENLVLTINTRLRELRARAPKPPVIVGERYHQSELERVFQKASVTGSTTQRGQLIPEPDNPHDPSAVAVVVKGERIGYLKKEAAAAYSPALQRHGAPVPCSVFMWREQGGEAPILARFSEVPPSPADLGG
jgi:hypothetical protein